MALTSPEQEEQKTKIEAIRDTRRFFKTLNRLRIYCCDECRANVEVYCSCVDLKESKDFVVRMMGELPIIRKLKQVKYLTE